MAAAHLTTLALHPRIVVVPGYENSKNAAEMIQQIDSLVMDIDEKMLVSHYNDSGYLGVSEEGLGYMAELIINGVDVRKSGFTSQLDAAAWHAKATFWRDWNKHMVNRANYPPLVESAQSDIVSYVEKLRHETGFAKVRAEGFKPIYDNDWQGKTWDMLRPADVLVGNNGLCQNYVGSMAFHEKWKELYYTDNPRGMPSDEVLTKYVMPSDEVLTKYVKSLMDAGPNRVRIMVPYKDTPNGEELWGSIGGFNEYFHHVKNLIGGYHRDKMQAAAKAMSSSERQKVEKLTHSFVVSVFAKGDTGGCYTIHPKVVGVFATKEIAVAQIPTFKSLQPCIPFETFEEILDDIERYPRGKITDNRSNPPDNGILLKIEYPCGELDEIRIEKFPLVDN